MQGFNVPDQSLTVLGGKLAIRRIRQSCPKLPVLNELTGAGIDPQDNCVLRTFKSLPNVLGRIIRRPYGKCDQKILILYGNISQQALQAAAPFSVGGVALLGIVCQDVGITVRHNIFHVKNVIFKKRLHSQSNILQDVSDCAAVDFRLIPVTHMNTHDQKNAGLKRKEFIMKCSAVVCQCLPQFISAQDRRFLPQLVPHGVLAGSPLQKSAIFLKETFQYQIQVGLADRLRQVVLHAEAYRLLGIFKLPVSTNHDKFCLELLLAGLFNHFQPSHSRHLNICNNNIRFLPQNDLHSVYAILTGAKTCHFQRFPVDQLMNELTNIRFIVHDQDLQHNSHSCRIKKLYL